MIKSINDCDSICGCCGQPTIHRQILICSSNGAERVHAYQTHANNGCMTHSTHQDRLQELDEIVERVESLRQQVLDREAKKKILEYGSLVDIDFTILDVDPCTDYNEMMLRPMVTIRAFKQSRELALPEICNAGLEAGTLIAQIAATAKVHLDDMKSNYDRGDF